MKTKTKLAVVERAIPSANADSATLDLYKAQGREAADAQKEHSDVQIYHDVRARRPFARFPWHYSNCPTKRNKYVTLNCCRWRLRWLAPLKSAIANPKS